MEIEGIVAVEINEGNYVIKDIKVVIYEVHLVHVNNQVQVIVFFFD